MVSVMWQKSLRSVGVLPLVKRVAVWVLMLKHIQAPHTDALKTHFTQNISAALLECEKSIGHPSPGGWPFQSSRLA